MAQAARVLRICSVGELAVDSLRALERTGAAPFVPKLKIASSNDKGTALSPTLVKDLNGDGLPEIILPGANELHWNRGNWKFDLEPLLRFPKDRPQRALSPISTATSLMDLLAFSQTLGNPCCTCHRAGQFTNPAP